MHGETSQWLDNWSSMSLTPWRWSRADKAGQSSIYSLHLWCWLSCVAVNSFNSEYWMETPTREWTDRVLNKDRRVVLVSGNKRLEKCDHEQSWAMDLTNQQGWSKSLQFKFRYRFKLKYLVSAAGITEGRWLHHNGWQTGFSNTFICHWLNKQKAQPQMYAIGWAGVG